MAEVLKVLRAANAGPECIKAAVEKIMKDCVENDALQEQYIQNGLVEALRGICSSGNNGVCSSVLKALSLLAHDNMQVKLKLLKPMGLLLKLINLCSVKDHQLTGNTTAILQIHEQAVGLIRKLVLHPECMPEVASLDVIYHMIELCGIFFDDSQHTSCCLGVSQYSPKATSYLSDLSHGKCLIGKIQELSPEASKKIIKDSKVRGILSSDQSPCALSVDLYDTTTDQDILINEEIIKEGLAWPQFLMPEKKAKMFIKCQGKEEFFWADIRVTSVHDGGHFWAHVGGEVIVEKLKEITKVLQSEELARLKRAPKVGDLVCMKTMIGGHQDIHRLKVTEASLTLDGTMAEVFAVDYGFKNVVAVDSLRELPALGQKEPFQARFCCLSGVQAPPKDPMVLENAAGALRNLAYRSNACRLQILEKDGVDALIKLCSVPNIGVRTQAAGAILNVSMNFKTRARICHLGGVKVLFDICQRYLRQDVKLVCLAVGALRNLMLDSPTNRCKVAEADGLPILTQLYFTSTDTELKQQCLGALKNLVGNSWYLLTGDGGVDLRSIVDDKYSKPFTLSVGANPSTRASSVRERTHKRRPGEVEPKPIEKALPFHVIKSANPGKSSCEEATKEGMSHLSQDEITDGDTDYGEERLLSPSPVSVQELTVEPSEKEKGIRAVSENCKRFYVRGQMFPFCDDEQHELRESTSVKGLSSAVISRPACAFLNARKGGTVYLGVKKSRIVCGVEIGRKDRDLFRLGVDELLGEFKPAVKYDKYQVNFVPVTKVNSARRTDIEFIPDVFVIEVTFQKCSGTVYSTNKKRCYFRCGTANSEFSTQDIRQWVIRDQEAFYNKEIKSLKKELSEARRKRMEEGS